MDDAKHTPGPWEVTDQNGDPEENFRGVRGPASTNRLGRQYHTYVAQYCLPHDASLIAAAPDLLKALKDLLHVYDQLVSCGDCGVSTRAEETPEGAGAIAAIAKEEGQP